MLSRPQVRDYKYPDDEETPVWKISELDKILGASRSSIMLYVEYFIDDSFYQLAFAPLGQSFVSDRKVIQRSVHSSLNLHNRENSPYRHIFCRRVIY